jgi:hypothetical protein
MLAGLQLSLKKEVLTVELLAAAQGCGHSLQKSLALPRVGTLCADLAGRLLRKNWRPGPYTRFAVEEPKLREILAPGFGDRVVESWLTTMMGPSLERLLIDDTYANRKGKGPLAAIDKVQRLMRRPGHEWCLQLDFRCFFHSIHRPTLSSLWLDFLLWAGLEPGRLDLATHISTAILEHDPVPSHHVAPGSEDLLAKIPPGKSLLHSPPGTGIPIGSVASQHFANFYLNGLDHFIKHQLQVKGYVRYMDDLLLLGQSPVVLHGWRDAISAYAATLRLALHPGKEQLGRVTKGIDYLGCRLYPHHRHPDTSLVKTLKARLDFFKHLIAPDEFPKCQHPRRGSWLTWLQDPALTPPLQPSWTLLKRMEATINSYLGLMGHSESRRLRRSLFDKHFGLLRRFFSPSDASFNAVHVKKRFQRPFY